MKKQKKKNYNWIFPLIFYLAVLAGIGLVVYTVHINSKDLTCLKPYAEQYCRLENHSYIDHNLVYMTCSNENYDARLMGSSNVVQYYFNETERKICKVNE